MLNLVVIICFIFVALALQKLINCLAELYLSDKYAENRVASKLSKECLGVNQLELFYLLDELRLYALHLQ